MNEEYYIRLSGKANIPEPLEMGKNYKITADCSILSENIVDDQGGTKQKTYKAVPVTCEIVADNGKTIKAKDKRRISQTMRNYLFKLHADSNAVIYPFDEVYEKVSYKAMSMYPSILREVVKELEEKEQNKDDF